MRLWVLVAVTLSAALPMGAGAFATGPTAAETEAILKLDDDWAAAEMRRDGAALERILDDRFIATLGASKPVDKATFIRQLLAEDSSMVVTQKLSDRSVVVAGETAVLVEVDTQTATKNAQTKISTWRFTITYIRRQGRWLALAEHGAPTQPSTLASQ